ncbi:hypothetical protein VTK56DRAFT_611 [Thermocarpiscus australiensis]
MIPHSFFWILLLLFLSLFSSSFCRPIRAGSCPYAGLRGWVSGCMDECVGECRTGMSCTRLRHLHGISSWRLAVYTVLGEHKYMPAMVSVIISVRLVPDRATGAWWLLLVIVTDAMDRRYLRSGRSSICMGKGRDAETMACSGKPATHACITYIAQVL